MVRKFSFCSYFYVNVPQTFTFNTFYRFEKSLYFIKHVPEVEIFYSYSYFYISQEFFSQRVSLLTSLMKQYNLLRYITRYPTLEIQYSKILSGGIDFISLNHRIHHVVYTRQVSGRLNDNLFSHVSVL